MIKTKQVKKINIDDNFNAAISYAKKIYLEGKVFIYPTDTIYGFGANPFNQDSIKRINVIKQRELGKMFILLISDVQTLQKYADIRREKHLDFLNSMWPNPISFVLKLNDETAEIFDSSTAAFRIPNNRFCLKLLKEIKMPLVSTSVNRSNNKPLNEIDLIENEFDEEVDAIFYSAKKSFFTASTAIAKSYRLKKLMLSYPIDFF